jgi:hypothetical protein
VGFDPVFEDSTDTTWGDVGIPKPRPITELHMRVPSCNNVFTIIAARLFPSIELRKGLGSGLEKSGACQIARPGGDCDGHTRIIVLVITYLPDYTVWGTEGRF